MSALRVRLLRARESFWFLPALLGIVAIVLAQLLISLDRRLDGKDLGVWGLLLYRVGASGSRDTLGAIGGSMFAVAAELAVGLVPLSTRPAPLLGRVDGAGNYRATVTRAPATDLIDQVFDAMRHYGLGNPIAVSATAELGHRIGTATVHSDIRQTVLRQLAALNRAYSGSDSDPIDIETGRTRVVATTSAITAQR